MLDLLDLLLLKRGLPSDDHTLSFRRIDGDPNAKVIYFLPWHTPLSICRQAGFTPLNFLACYEMPCAIVSSDPSLGVKAMHLLVADAEALLLAHGISCGAICSAVVCHNDVRDRRGAERACRRASTMRHRRCQGAPPFSGRACAIRASMAASCSHVHRRCSPSVSIA